MIDETIDEGFIKQLKQKNENAYRWLLDYCKDIALSFTKDVESAEDIAQISIEKILHKIDSYKSNKGKGNIATNFKSYVFKIVRNAFLDYRKDFDKLTYQDYADATELTDLDTKLLESTELLSCDNSHNQQWFVALREVIQSFSEIKSVARRTAIILHFVLGYTIKETADLLGRNRDAVNTDIDRGKRELREIFKKRGIERDHLDQNFWRFKF